MSSDRLQFGHFRLLRTLGRGATAKVKLAVDETSGEQVALKIYRRTLLERFTIEAEALALVSAHPNVVVVRNAVEKATYYTSSGQEREVAYVELEYCAQGELIGFLFARGALPDNCARRCSRYIAEALAYIHSKGVAHRDLKPENILINGQFQVKVADFGYAKIADSHCRTHRGTKGYIAPEIMRCEEYDGFKADLFALGVIIYILHTGRPPFTQAVPNDRFYSFIAGNRWGEFWLRNQRVEGTPRFSEEFKDLTQHLLSSRPEERLSAMDVLQHPWLATALAEPEELIQWFRDGVAEEVPLPVAEQHEQGYRALHLSWQDSTGTADNSEAEELGLFRSASRLPETCPLGVPTAFTCKVHPDRLFEALESVLSRKGAVVTKHSVLFRMKVRLPGESDWLEFSCSLVEEASLVRAEFHRLGGDVFLLVSLLSTIVTELRNSE